MIRYEKADVSELQGSHFHHMYNFLKNRLWKYINSLKNKLYNFGDYFEICNIL